MRFLLLVLALSLTGCNMSGQSPPRHKYKTPDAIGRKLIVVNDHGDTLAKVRIRSDGTRLYGPDMLPFGMVSRDENGLGFQRYGETTTSYLEPDPSGIWECADSLRIEPVDRGWAIFGANAKLIGYVEFAQGWTFRLGYDDKAKWVVTGREVVSNADTVCSGRSGRLEPEMTLSLCIEGLPVESRALLGVWLQEQNERRSSTKT